MTAVVSKIKHRYLSTLVFTKKKLHKDNNLSTIFLCSLNTFKYFLLIAFLPKTFSLWQISLFGQKVKFHCKPVSAVKGFGEKAVGKHKTSLNQYLT